jgi:hypothetical protein
MTAKPFNPARLGSAGLLAAALLAASAMTAASDGPAVSDFNTKISGFGGAAGYSGDNDGMGGIATSITAPIGYSLGLQIDGAYARIGDDNFGSAGAHLFWRDPSRGLLGIYTGFAVLDRGSGAIIGRSGVEAQYYAGALTLDTAAGYEYGDLHKGYGRARLQFYPVDDLMLRAGWAYETRNLGTAGIEYQFANTKNSGMSMFVDGSVGADSTYSVVGGVKVTFGESMSLKDRHRRQDPDAYQQFDLQAVQKAAKPAAEQPCPFTPKADLCGVVSMQPKTYAKIGIQLHSPVTLASWAPQGRYKQCSDAGYSKGSPGPSACGCAAAFNTCGLPPG